MLLASLFWVFLLSASTLMLAYGEVGERWFMAFVAVATAVTTTLNSLLGVSDAFSFVMIVDGLLLIIALAYVLRSDKYWPIWFAGFHLITVSTELASVAFPGELPGLYISLAGLWSMPALGIAAYGCILDRRLS